jgi:uncharacterized membrane protein YhhN
MLSRRGGISRLPKIHTLGWSLLTLSAALAIAYGVTGDTLSPFYAAQLKASGILVLVGIAAISLSRLLAAGLLFGAIGDMGLALNTEPTFLIGAGAFLIGHLFYIALFLRAGLGVAALREPPRLLGALGLLAAALVMTVLLVPQDNALFVPLSIYTGVLTLMAISSFTLPATRWLAIGGAVLFFISDGFVAWNMFHEANDPTLAFWRGFAGWMIYWAGQAGIGIGALGLHKVGART